MAVVMVVSMAMAMTMTMTLLLMESIKLASAKFAYEKSSEA